MKRQLRLSTRPVVNSRWGNCMKLNMVRKKELKNQDKTFDQLLFLLNLLQLRFTKIQSFNLPPRLKGVNFLYI